MTVDERLRGAADDLRADVPAWSDPEAALDRVLTARRRPSVRPGLLAAAVLVAVVLGAAVLAIARDDGGDVAAGPAPTTAAPRPTTPGPATGESVGLPMTVDPAEGLEDGDRVQVTVDDLPSSDVGLYQCRSDALLSGDGMSGCDGLAGSSTANAQGHLEGSVTVRRHITVGPAQQVLDCAREVRCAIGVAIDHRVPGEEPGSSWGRPELVGLIAIDLAPQAPAAEPSAEVTPADGLRHGQVVTVAGEGFADPVGSASLCEEGASIGGPGCTFVALTGAAYDLANPRLDDDGGFAVEVPIWRMIPVPEADGSVRLIDCAEVACTLQVVGGDGRAATPVPLSFDPTPPPPVVPALDVTPTVGIRSGDDLGVTVDGLAEGVEATLLVCAIEADGPIMCGARAVLGPVVGEAGGSVTVSVEAVDLAGEGIDCTEPGRCAVALEPADAFTGDPVLQATPPVPVRFAPP